MQTKHIKILRFEECACESWRFMSQLLLPEPASSSELLWYVTVTFYIWFDRFMRPAEQYKLTMWDIGLIFLSWHWIAALVPGNLHFLKKLGTQHNCKYMIQTAKAYFKDGHKVLTSKYAPACSSISWVESGLFLQ